MSTLLYKGRPTQVPPKDPDAQRAYGFDWGPYLGDGVTIDTSEWIVEAGITADSDSHDDTTTSVKISGGEAGKQYRVTNRITFSRVGLTEQDDRTMILPVREL